MCRGEGDEGVGACIPVSCGVLVDSRGQWRGYVILFNCQRLAFDVPRLRDSVGGKREKRKAKRSE